MCSIGLLVNYLYINRDRLTLPAASGNMIPAGLPGKCFVCLLGALRVDGQADLEVFPSRVIPWFHMSTSRKPVSPNGDVGTHCLGLKPTRGMFRAL